MTNYAFGIGMGFLTAILQSLSYLLSRKIILQKNISPTLLFSVSHIHIGFFSIAILPFFLNGVPNKSIVLPLLGTAFFYLLAQSLLLIVLEKNESSKVTPLLSLKIPLLSIFLAIFYGGKIILLGWFAILLCLVGVFLISPPKGKVALKLLVSILVVCAGYAGSDLCIPLLVKELNYASEYPTLAAIALTYSIAGFFGGVLYAARFGAKINFFQKPLHKDTIAYSVAWFFAIASLFGCFTTIDLVLGNMVQSTRAIISVLLGLIVTRLGLIFVEDLSDQKTIVFRISGSILITGSIFLYFFSQLNK